MHVSEIWRYPVKSMRGQRLTQSDVLRTGLVGDRSIVVVSRTTGRFITSRTHPGLLGLSGAVQDDGSVTINGKPWNSAEALQLVDEAAKEHVDLEDLGSSTERFDILPLLVATDGAINALGIDSRRIRPNIIVAGVAGLAEREWPGRFLRIGPVEIEVVQLRARCVMTTYDPDTLVQDRNVLFRIVSEMGGKLALDCAVRQPGLLRENDPVELLS